MAPHSRCPAHSVLFICTVLPLLLSLQTSTSVLATRAKGLHTLWATQNPFASILITRLPPLKPRPSPGGRKSVQPTSARLAQVNSGAAPSTAPKAPSSTVLNTATDPTTQNASLAKASPAERRSLLVWPGTGRPGRPVVYHGGAILTGSIHVYLLLYGNWSANVNAVAVLANFILSISNSSADSLGPSVHKWWNILLQYTQNDGSAVASQVTLAGVYMVPGPYNTTLSDGTGPTSNDDIFGLVDAAVQAGQLPLDPLGVYAVLTSADVRVGPAGNGFCSSYCGWHGWKELRGTAVPYIFVGDPSLQCTTCGSKLARVNGYPGAESMVTSLAHELAEAASNPNIDTYKGWWSTDLQQNANEVADLCNRVYRNDADNYLYTDSGFTYMFNLFGLHGYKYLVQGLPNLRTQSCALQGSTPSQPKARDS